MEKINLGTQLMKRYDQILLRRKDQTYGPRTDRNFFENLLPPHINRKYFRLVIAADQDKFVIDENNVFGSGDFMEDFSHALVGDVDGGLRITDGDPPDAKK
jgi:hypothetical protein